MASLFDLGFLTMWARFHRQVTQGQSQTKAISPFMALSFRGYIAITSAIFYIRVKQKPEINGRREVNHKRLRLQIAATNEKVPSRRSKTREIPHARVQRACSWGALK